MPSGARATRSSKRQHVKDADEYKGGMIDILAAYDTRYPERHCKVKGPTKGNGPHPGNPFGRKMKRPDVGKGGPR